MLQIPPDTGERFETTMQSTEVPVHLRPHFRKWLRFYLDFCAKYGFDPTLGSSFAHFNAKLRSKGQEEWKRRQAYQAVVLYLQSLSCVGAGREDRREIQDRMEESASSKDRNAQRCLADERMQAVRTSGETTAPETSAVTGYRSASSSVQRSASIPLSEVPFSERSSSSAHRVNNDETRSRVLTRNADAHPDANRNTLGSAGTG